MAASQVAPDTAARADSVRYGGKTGPSREDIPDHDACHYGYSFVKYL